MKIFKLFVRKALRIIHKIRRNMFMKKLSLRVLVTSVVLLSAAGAAFGASVTVQNSLNIRLSLAFYYTSASGGAVTQGWWHVEPDSETVVTLNADESKPIYYAAFNKRLFADSSTIKNSMGKRWFSYRRFTYRAGVVPDDYNTFESRLFRVPDDGVVNVDGDSRGR
jgi:uncharacterized membrane protein